MKIHRSKSKSGLFLIELIIAIVFFSVASAICIQLFVRAHLMNQRSTDISMAVSLAQSYAEEFKALPYSLETGATEIYYGYDEAGQLIRLENGNSAAYVLKADIRDEVPSLQVANITVLSWKGPGSLLQSDILCALEARRSNLL